MFYFAFLILFLKVAEATSVLVQFRVQQQDAVSETSPITYEELEHWGHYAAAAYQEFEDWNATCQQHEDIKDTVLETTWSTKLPSSWYSQGYVGVNSLRREVVVVFKGTTHPMDVLTDSQAVLVDWPAGSTDSRVHLGFLTAYLAASDQVQTTVRRLQDDTRSKDYSLWFVGHSLGAAQAQLAYVEYGGNGANLVTYGSPRVGNSHFAEFVNQSIRVVHEADIVPHSPSSLPWLGRNGYMHGGQEVWDRNNQELVICGVPGEDRECSASVSIFRRNLLDHMVYPGIQLLY